MNTIRLAVGTRGVAGGVEWAPLLRVCSGRSGFWSAIRVIIVLRRYIINYRCDTYPRQFISRRPTVYSTAGHVRRPTTTNTNRIDCCDEDYCSARLIVVARRQSRDNKWIIITVIIFVHKTYCSAPPRCLKEWTRIRRTRVLDDRLSAARS